MPEVVLWTLRFIRFLEIYNIWRLRNYVLEAEETVVQYSCVSADYAERTN